MDHIILSIVWLVPLKNISDLNVLQFMKMRMDHPSNAKVTFQKMDQSLSIKILAMTHSNDSFQMTHLNLKMSFQI